MVGGGGELAGGGGRLAGGGGGLSGGGGRLLIELPFSARLISDTGAGTKEGRHSASKRPSLSSP